VGVAYSEESIMEEQTFRFSDQQRDAVVNTIGYGSYQGEPMRIVKRLERYAARYHSRVIERGLTPAIIGAEQITQFISVVDGLTRPDGLWCALSDLQRPQRRRIARWIGGEYFHLEDYESDRVNRGKEILGECRTLTNDLRKAAVYAREKAYSRIWDSEDRADREFRTLCLGVANTWYDFSIEGLPDVTCKEVPRRLEEHENGDRNALWVTLDALEIDVSDYTLSNVLEFIGRELFRRGPSELR
jgi:hypothetical protein